MNIVQLIKSNSSIVIIIGMSNSPLRPDWINNLINVNMKIVTLILTWNRMNRMHALTIHRILLI